MSSKGTGDKVVALGEIAARVGAAAPPAGAADLAISGVAALEDAQSGQLSFVTSDAFVKGLAKTRASAVLVNKKVKFTPRPTGNGPAILLVDDAELAMSKVLELFSFPPCRPDRGVDAQARIDPTADLALEVTVGPFTSIGRRTRVGRGTIIHSHVYIGDDVTIGEGCEIYPNVTIRERITIGSRVIINAGCVLGTDGFGYRWDGTKHAKVPQIGTIIIEDDVEMGSCVCIDRAKFSATRIGRGTKIDNLVQIAHNVVIGPNCILVGQVGLAGSATLGTGVTLGGQVAVRDHVTLGDGAMVAARGAVAEDIPAGTVVSGMPALPHRQTLREQAAIRRLPDLVVQVRKLQEEVERLKGERK
jgi:UDP-3-O-[3-hydroxymyristoyl] glucosamine N-acyltransferase